MAEERAAPEGAAPRTDRKGDGAASEKPEEQSQGTGDAGILPRDAGEGQLAKRYHERFRGLERAHGEYRPASQRSNNGKVEGKARTVAEPARVEDWERHLAGEVGLGVVPVRDDGTCVWGAIDVDDYKLDLKHVERQVNTLGLPLIVTRTKSGGAHLFLFLRAPTRAREVRALLREWAAALGHSGVEVFPKQDELAEGETGNWLNMPYFNGRLTERYALKNGEGLLPEEFLDYAAERATTLAEARAIPVEPARPEVSEDEARGFTLPETIAEGGRNDALYRYACSLRARGWADDDALQEEVARVNAERCDPPLGDKEVLRLVKSACKRPVGPSNNQDDKEPWPEPVDVFGEGLAPPELPAGAVPEAIEAFARAKGRQMGADAGGLALAALATCAAALDDRVQVKVKRHDDWLESARLWVALVGNPSTKKTPVIDAAIAPLRNLDKERYEAWKQEVEAWENQDPNKRGPKPTLENLMLEDATPEAAAVALVDNPRGVLLHHDELASFFGAMDKYSAGKGGQANRGFWLKAYNGGYHKISRIGRGVSCVPNLSVSVVGGVQPTALRELTTGAVDDGLLQRLVPIVLQSGGRDLDEPDGGATDNYWTLVRGLYDLAAPVDWQDASIRAVELSDAARTVRERAADQHLRLAALDGVAPKLTSHFGKWDGLFARLCLLFHAIEHADHGDLPHEVVGETAERVYRFMQCYLRHHAFALYEQALRDGPQDERARAMAGFLLAKKVDEVTTHHFSKAGSAMRKASRPEQLAAMEVLETHGWVKKAPGQRRDQEKWRVNPRVHERFQERAEAERRRVQEGRQALREAFQNWSN